MNFFKNKKIKNKHIGINVKFANAKHGFTLVETLVSIAILTLAITGAFTAAQGGITSSIFSKDQIVAFYLAQEGIEQIRNIRDNNGLAGVNWLNGLSPCISPNVCTVDVTDNFNGFVKNCGTAFGACPFVLQDKASGLYVEQGSDTTETQFKREIQITNINSNEASIVVKISWSKGIINRHFDIRENIFNWQ